MKKWRDYHFDFLVRKKTEWKKDRVRELFPHAHKFSLQKGKQKLKEDKMSVLITAKIIFKTIFFYKRNIIVMHTKISILPFHFPFLKNKERYIHFLFSTFSSLVTNTNEGK